MKATLEEGGTGPQGHIPRKNKNPEEKTVWIEVPWRTTVLNLEFNEMMLAFRDDAGEIGELQKKVIDRNFQSLSKTSKPTALHTEGTAQVSERLNISDTAKKLH